MTTLTCPDCDIGRGVRASVFDAGFWSDFVMIALPLLVVGACTMIFYRIGRTNRLEEPPRTGRGP